MDTQLADTNHIAGYLRELAAEFDHYPAVKKLDWGKILELIMQILPLILAFFQQDYRKPGTD